MSDKSNIFENKVLNAVKNIPSGETLSYKQVAKLAGKPKAYRAVGNILSHNYNPQIPCHRVIHANGSIGQYNRGTTNKARLLKQEKNGN